MGHQPPTRDSKPPGIGAAIVVLMGGVVPLVGAFTDNRWMVSVLVFALAIALSWSALSRLAPLSPASEVDPELDSAVARQLWQERERAREVEGWLQAVRAEYLAGDIDVDEFEVEVERYLRLGESGERPGPEYKHASPFPMPQGIGAWRSVPMGPSSSACRPRRSPRMRVAPRDPRRRW